MACSLKLEQECAASHILDLALEVVPAPKVAEFFGESGTAPGGVIDNQLLDQLNISRCYFASLYNHVIFHGCHNIKGWQKSPEKNEKCSRKNEQAIRHPIALPEEYLNSYLRTTQTKKATGNTLVHGLPPEYPAAALEGGRKVLNSAGMSVRPHFKYYMSWGFYDFPAAGMAGFKLEGG